MSHFVGRKCDIYLKRLVHGFPWFGFWFQHESPPLAPHQNKLQRLSGSEDVATVRHSDIGACIRTGCGVLFCCSEALVVLLSIAAI